MKKTFLAVFVVLLVAAVCFFCVGCSLFGGKAVSIESIEKTGTEGLVDTYTITMTDGTTSTFTVTNGQGSNQLPSDTYTPEHYFRFELLDDDTYKVEARYKDMYPTIVIPSKYNGKAVTVIQVGAGSIDNLVIPTSVTTINGLYSKSVTYEGTKSQWNNISKIDENFFAEVIHCTDGDINLD